mgnify:FL=1
MRGASNIANKPHNKNYQMSLDIRGVRIVNSSKNPNDAQICEGPWTFRMPIGFDF